MAVDEEARARSVLDEMQLRLAQGPHATLGLGDTNASAEAVRTAFLQLTKQFHPARFGRMSTELQRLSNEVFLGIKSAHETLLRSLGAPARGGVRAQQSGSMPPLTADPRLPRASGTTHPAPAVPRTLTPTGPRPMHGERTPPYGTRLGSPQPPQTRPGTPPIAPPTHPPTQPPSHPPTQPPTQPPTFRPGAPLQRPGTPPHTAAPRPPSPAPPLRQSEPRLASPATPPLRQSEPRLAPPAPSPDPATVRGSPFAMPKTTAAFDERVELQQALDALNAKDWPKAKSLFNNLAVRVPASKQYRALLAVTRGHEARAAGRAQDAMMEFDRALEVDPDNQQAKSAKADLFRRR